PPHTWSSECTMTMSEVGVRSESTSPRERTKSGAFDAHVNRYRAALREQLEAPVGHGVALAKKHAEIADALTSGIFEEARSRVSAGPLLLGAVGGVGRGPLGIGSDLDLCFVTLECDEAVSECIQAMLYPLWDAGIQVGHQVVQLSEVVSDAASDLTMATELLDFRPLAGDHSLLPLLQEHLRESIFFDEKIGHFIEQLESGVQKRHEQFGDSGYLLEPDLKYGQGGLRDLELALWAARARFGESAISELSKLKLITSEMEEQTERAVDFLWTVRNHLHRASGRKADRLTFSEQERIAEKMGYARQPAPGVPRLQHLGEMVEAFMFDYYRHARVIAQASTRILGRAKRGVPSGAPSVIHHEGGIAECEGRVGLSETERIRTEPVLAFRMYAIALARGVQLLSRTRDAISVATADPVVCESLRSSPEANQIFVALLCTS